GLIDDVTEKAASEITDRVELSDALTQLNVEGDDDWNARYTETNARQAAPACHGGVYEGRDAPSLSDDQLQWAQVHVAMPSGRYGVQRPLDLTQPYRREMGTRLATGKGKTLYDYWGAQIAQYLNKRRGGQAEPLVLNLASEEYFKAVDLDTL